MAKKEVSPELTLDDTTENLIEWVRRNARPLAIGAIAVVVVLALGMFWRSAAARKEANAGRDLTAAQRAVVSGNAALAQSDLQRLIQRYDGTKASIQARMLLAQVMFDQGKADSGLAVLEAEDSPGPFAASYHAITAAGLEQAGKLPEAAAAYLRASDAAISKPDRAAHRADAARVYQAAGNVEQAKQIWTELAADDAGPMAGEAKVRLGELNAQPVSKS